MTEDRPFSSLDEGVQVLVIELTNSGLVRLLVTPSAGLLPKTSKPMPLSSKMLGSIISGEVPGADSPEELPDRSEEFAIGGVNDTEIIRGLRTINGVPVWKLEKLMRPAITIVHGDLRASGGISNAGFLGKDESLLDVLARDNDTVRELGLTHRQLAEVLNQIVSNSSGYDNKQIIIEGRSYTVSSVSWRGLQNSPFQDNTQTNRDYTVTNSNTGESIKFSGLLPEMIGRYGFYEGEGTSYRLSPESIISFFSLTTESS